MEESPRAGSPNHFCSPSPFEEDEIDLVELWHIIWKRRRLITTLVIFVTLTTIAVSLLMKNIYRSEAVILPLESSPAGKLGEFAGLAAIAGMSLPVSSTTAEIKARLSSRMLYARIIQKYSLLPLLFPDKWDPRKHCWKNPENHPTIEDGIRSLRQSLVHVSVDRKTESITISVDFPDPQVASRLVQYILKELREIMARDAEARAERTLRELERTLPRVADPLIQQKIYTLMAQQIETISLAKATESFAFKVIDPPRVPDKKYKPKRALMTAVAFVSSLFLGIFLAFFLEYIENVRQRSSKEGGKNGAF